MNKRKPPCTTDFNLYPMAKVSLQSRASVSHIPRQCQICPNTFPSSLFQWQHTLKIKLPAPATSGKHRVTSAEMTGPEASAENQQLPRAVWQAHKNPVNFPGKFDRRTSKSRDLKIAITVWYNSVWPVRSIKWETESHRAKARKGKLEPQNLHRHCVSPSP